LAAPAAERARLRGAGLPPAVPIAAAARPLGGAPHRPPRGCRRLVAGARICYMLTRWAVTDLYTSAGVSQITRVRRTTHGYTGPLQCRLPSGIPDPLGPSRPAGLRVPRLVCGARGGTGPPT